MFLGIPRGAFYYDYYGFIQRLFDNKKIEIVCDVENNDDILNRGSITVVDEACLPIKLTAGQVELLTQKCDKVLIPRVVKDHKGRWLCPKLLGIPELLMDVGNKEKLIFTGPIDFSNKRTTRREFSKVCGMLGMDRKAFMNNFERAYNYQEDVCFGKKPVHIEADWELAPHIIKEGEIILPNMGKVLLMGHCYNIYDKYNNNNIFNRLDEMGLDVITERSVNPKEMEMALRTLGLIKTPFWEALVRTLGAAICLKRRVEGIIYISSFSCGLDSFLIEMVKYHVDELPLMVIKLDEHKGNAGFETRLEAFVDLLERRRLS